MHLHLKDNQPIDKSRNGQINEDSCKTVLRYLSSHPLQSIKDDNGCDVLVFPHSFKETQDDLKDAFVLNYVENLDGNPEYISTNNLVGFIGYKDVEISIHSRFSSGKGDETQDFFLYHMLSKTMSINMFNLPTSSGTDMAFDFLLFFFPKLLKEAMSQGLYKKYVYHEYNDAKVRGVIDINRHIRRNIPANGRIAYRTREFSFDNPMTQLIRHAIEFIRRKPLGKAVLHNDPDTEGYVQQIIQATPSFQPRQMQSVINENLRPVSHPYYTKYAALQKLCLRILRHEKLSYGENGDKIHGILIDAAWLWEEYVAGVISGIGGQHYIKPSPFWLFTKENEKGPFQQVIPDYMKGEDGKCEWIADAKYIPLAGVTHLPAEKAERVYYKTIMYMYRFCTETGFLFYPDDKVEQSNLVTFVIQGDRGGKLHMVSLAIPRLGKDYSSFKNAMGRQENLFKEKIRKKDGV
jgi:5-methylcytosine-specific restriction endonuclease McrBC regulatory subunit McrC